jgi:DNA-binding winged helix-turn-helix (wHTH) protein
VVGKEKLISTVWPGIAVTDDSLVQCIHDIRRALGPAGQVMLRTIPRRGSRVDPGTEGIIASKPVRAVS